MIHSLNLNDTKGALQSLLTAINRLELRLQGLGLPSESRTKRQFSAVFIQSAEAVKGLYSGAMVDLAQPIDPADTPQFATQTPNEDGSPDPVSVTLSGPSNCLVINANEFGFTGYSITQGTEPELEVGTLSIGVVSSFTNEDPSRPVVVIPGGRGDPGWTSNNADPELFGTFSGVEIGSDTEGVEDANTEEWNRGDGALKLWATTRVAYFHAGDNKLYGYAREIRIDGAGCVRFISGETRYEIDAPESCA